jgi:hypothetical protein
MKKICQRHNIEKTCRERFVKNKLRQEWICVTCESEYGKKYYENNKNNRIDYQNNYYKDNKNDVLNYKNHFYYENKENILKYKKIYYDENKILVRNTQNKYKRNRRKIDPVFRLQGLVSKRIYDILKNKKDNKSCLKYLLYTMEELKEHLEKQFESWMSWDNQGKYNKNWNDNDSSTWTWQIDHIKPHSTFKYTSMEDAEFKKCWALNNLRPLSSKQNWLDGVTRIRH